MDRCAEAADTGDRRAGEISTAFAAAARRSVRYRRIFQLLTMLLLLLAAGAAVYFRYLNVQLSDSVARMQVVREAMQENRKLLGLTIDLEAGLRGYLLTADDRHLAGYEAADAAIPGQLAALEQILEGRDYLVAELATIRETLEAKRLELSAVQRSFERGERRDVRQSYRRDLGERRTNSLRASVGVIENYLESASVAEREIAAVLMRRQFTAIAITLATVALIGIAVMLLGRRHFETLRRHAELSIALSRSQQRSEDKTVFLAQVSHEIRTPMNAIVGFSGLLEDRLDDPHNRRYIQAITTSAHALLGVVNDLLDYSSIEAGKIGLTRRPSDLRDIVDAVITLLAPQAADKRLQLSAAIDENVPAALLVDGDRVRQMLLNLVGNAVKYTQQGSVTVRVSAQSGVSARTATCIVSVADTGPGIPAEQHGRVFEPFARGDRTGGIAGTGLGLSITRQLARAMGGDVSVVSSPGAGSCFTLVLPDLPILPALVDGARAALRLRDLPPLRVLAVDDVDLNLKVVSAMFADAGHELRLANGGAEALRIIEQWQPDIALLDVRMAGIDGVEVARRLRNRETARPICLLAVTATKLDAREGDGALFDAVVVKPFTEQTLAAAMVYALDVCRETVPIQDPHPSAATTLPVEQLDILSERWQSLRTALTISEARAFASMLQEIGERHHNPSMQRYGRSLLGAAATFDVAQLEALLERFPERIAELSPDAPDALQASVPRVSGKP